MAETIPLNLSISLFDDDETRWQAVCSRNAHADGFFVYCVRSTRIYCRPICKARLARRANVTFYDTPCEARDAGFRACKRCKPDLEGSMPEDAAVGKIRAFVSSSGGGTQGNETMSLGQMARKAGLSKWHFHRVFKKCVGVTPVEYVRMRARGQNGGSPVSASTLDRDPDWLQNLDWGNIDFAPLDSPLTDGSSGSEMVDGDLSWMNLLVWPDDDSKGPN